eukprot:scaffold46397_cov28-Tisochrysis_lutea.AAC.1
MTTATGISRARAAARCSLLTGASPRTAQQHRREQSGRSAVMPYLRNHVSEHHKCHAYESGKGTDKPYKNTLCDIVGTSNATHVNAGKSASMPYLMVCIYDRQERAHALSNGVHL